MKTRFFGMLSVLVVTLTFFGVKAGGDDVFSTISSNSISIENSFGACSGVVFTRKDSTCLNDVSFVWTAGHLVHDTREVAIKLFSLDSINEKVPGLLNVFTVTHYQTKNSRIVSTNVQLGTVIKYSHPSTNGIDIALIRLRQPIPTTKSVVFYLNDSTPQLGDDVFSISSPYGLYGTASKGIYSFIGRFDSEGAEYDQTTMPVYPGSSGAGVFLSNGKCVGFVIAIKSPTMSFILPIRKVKEWAARENVMWALDENYPIPDDFELMFLPVEDRVVQKTNTILH